MQRVTQMDSIRAQVKLSDGCKRLLLKCVNMFAFEGSGQAQLSEKSVKQLLQLAALGVRPACSSGGSLPLSRVGVPLLLLSHALPLEALEAILLLLLLRLHATLLRTHAHVHLADIHAGRASRTHRRRTPGAHGVEASLSTVRPTVVARGGG
jgi:hypothetical protein